MYSHVVGGGGGPAPAAPRASSAAVTSSSNAVPRARVCGSPRGRTTARSAAAPPSRGGGGAPSGARRRPALRARDIRRARQGVTRVPALPCGARVASSRRVLPAAQPRMSTTTRVRGARGDAARASGTAAVAARASSFVSEVAPPAQHERRARARCSSPRPACACSALRAGQAAARQPAARWTPRAGAP
jgi:hypothetical protein